MSRKKPILRGAEIFVRFLKDAKVHYLFGYPGGAVLHIYDELYKQQAVEHVLVRHEQGATHAADGYARATGKAGVVLVTSGPGATNAVTGIATAYMDSIPMVVFTGQVHTQAIGNDAFQEVDSVGITRPCVKHNFLVKDVRDLAYTMRKAFYVATTGRPGPVVVDVPKDVTADACEYEYPPEVEMRSYKPITQGHPGQIKRAARLILEARKLMLYTGGGVILGEASKELIQLVKFLKAPVTNTLMGLGAYPATDSQFLGMLGMHGTYEANMAMHYSDVLLAIGARFDDRVTGELNKFCPDAKIIHIDIDPTSISKNVEVDIPIVGEVKPVLDKLLAALKQKNDKQNKPNFKEWWQQINQWRKTDSLQYNRRAKIIKPQYVIEQLYEISKGDAYITSDVGQHQMWAAQFYKFDKPRRWINSGGLGTMGFGLPAAMGVKLAFRNKPVVCVTGEASLVMCIQELSTCLQYDLPVIIVLLNNRYMGMVRQWQEFFYESRYSHSYMDALPDFVKLAESFGHVGIRVERKEEVSQALKKAFKMKNRVVLIDFITDQTENVYPMIASGKGHHEMHLFSDTQETD